MADRKALLGGGAIALGVVAMAAALVSAPATAGETARDAASPREASLVQESTPISAPESGGSPGAPIASPDAPMHTALPLPTEPADAMGPHVPGGAPALPLEIVPPLLAAEALTTAPEDAGPRTSKGLYSRSPSTASEPRRAIPPSLSGEALRAELARGRAERERLEKLNAELDATRAAVRKETERLEQLIAKGRTATRTPAPAATPAPTTTPPADAPPADATPVPPDEAAAPETKAGLAEALARALEGAGSEDVDPRRLADLAKALKGMKPQQAAMVVSRVDDPLAARILLAMRPADAGPILARIPPERAGRLVQQIARLPEPSK